MAYIHYLKGNIFDSKAQVIVNTVNCKGVMGKGLALAFKHKYPDMFSAYERDCQTGKLSIGRPTLYQKSTPWILNFPTKNHWRFPSKLEYLEKGLAFLIAHYKRAGITSIAFPKLGAQNGQLSWDEVGPLMAKYLSQIDIHVYIYIAEGDKEYQYDSMGEAKINERIWQGFNDIALSAERLRSAVGLRAKDAKQIADTRLTTTFQSLADIEDIDKIAKASITKIKNFVQKHNMAELIVMPGKNSNSEKENTNSHTRTQRKKTANIAAGIVVSTLFEA
jgi:O-acetyl-ADP-ribose deacetylase (regulator of RNase III)